MTRIQVVFSDHVDGRDVRGRYSGEGGHCELSRFEAPDQDTIPCPFTFSFTADRDSSDEGRNLFGPRHFSEEFLIHVAYGFKPETLYGSSVHCFLDPITGPGDHSHHSFAVFDVVVKGEGSRIDTIARVKWCGLLEELSCVDSSVQTLTWHRG